MKSSCIAASISTHAPLCTGEIGENEREGDKERLRRKSADVFVTEEDGWHQRLVHNLHAFCVTHSVSSKSTQSLALIKKDNSKCAKSFLIFGQILQMQHTGNKEV